VIWSHDRDAQLQRRARGPPGSAHTSTVLYCTVLYGALTGTSTNGANVGDATVPYPPVALLNSQPTTSSPCVDLIPPYFPFLLSL
jgi:hypothetical protein